ncbi:IclR family transcriptional regulator [Nocardia sp. NPDC004068]|uniref:IclR family transcriptional regulator n=1 Tax=Nocardia sp. NPDC004068 TaxID=3364303 RepID=UPI0036BC8063
MRATTKNGTTGGRGVLEGAFALLDVLADGIDRGLTQLAAEAGLPKATAHRLLDQLVSLGAVERRDGRYGLGAKTFRLGQSWRPARLLRAAAGRPMGRLAANVDRGGFSLSVTAGRQTMLVAGIGREVNEAFPLRAGVVLPPGTAAGKILAPTTPFATAPEGCSPREWARTTAATREQGVAYDLDMRHVGVACVAAPVHAPSGVVVAALAATTFDLRRVHGLAEAVRRGATMITADLARLVRTERAGTPWPDEGAFAAPESGAPGDSRTRTA